MSPGQIQRTAPNDTTEPHAEGQRRPTKDDGGGSFGLQSWKQFGSGLFVGVTIFWLLAWALHNAHYIYVYDRATAPEDFRKLTDATADVSADIAKFEEVLDKAQIAVRDPQKMNLLPDGGLVLLSQALPDLVAENDWARLKNARFVIRRKGSEYKILVDSEICTAVALQRPDLVDPVRRRYPFFCRYFGVWSGNGEQL